MAADIAAGKREVGQVEIDCDRTVPWIGWNGEWQALQVFELQALWTRASRLITRRSKVQILPPQPIKSTACSDAGRFRFFL